jgi:hypothetical protein
MIFRCNKKKGRTVELDLTEQTAECCAGRLAALASA